MITVKALKDAFEEMKTIYPFADEKTDFRVSKSLYANIEAVIEIKTVDEKTGIEVIMAKDLTESIRKGNEE